MGFDIGESIYDLEDESGVLEMSARELGARKYAFTREFISSEVATKNKEQQKEIAQGKTSDGKEGEQPQAEAPQAEDKQEGDPVKQRLVAELEKLGAELDMIVADEMYDSLMYDFVFKLLAFKNNVEGAGHQDLIDNTVMLLHNMHRHITVQARLSCAIDANNVILVLDRFQDIVLPEPAPTEVFWHRLYRPR